MGGLFKVIDRTYWYDEETCDDACDWEWDESDDGSDNDDPTSRITDEELQSKPLTDPKLTNRRFIDRITIILTKERAL